MPRRPQPLTPEIVSPFLKVRRPPWWARVLQVLLAPVMLVLSLAAFLIGLVVVFVCVTGVMIWLSLARIMGRTTTVSDAGNEHAAIDRIEQTIKVDHFGTSSVRSGGEVTVDVDLPAFAQFDIRVDDELGGGHRPHTPGRYRLVLCDDDQDPATLDLDAMHVLFQWLNEHQHDVAGELAGEVLKSAWLGTDVLEEANNGPGLSGLFRVDAIRIVPEPQAVIELCVEQAWDIEHLWYFEITNIEGDLYDLELTLM